MAQLNPGNAASLAKLAYTAYASDDMEDFQKSAASQFPGNVSPVGQLIKGRTGLTRVTNSAVVFSRDGGGSQEKIVSIRGTTGGFSQDWLSNINVGLVPGPAGFGCHAGFFYAYRSLHEAVSETIGRRGQTVHVVGHSLGGAQANLMALDLCERGHNVYLYTFGAPRVGMVDFAAGLEKKLGGRVYRVYDPGDPVPMTPLFPFRHAPLGNTAYKSGADRTSISPDFHSMDDWYLPCAAHAGTWEGMRNTYSSNRLDFGPADWLRKAGEATHIPGSGAGFWALGRALEAIVRAVASSVQFLVTGILTVPDLLAWALMHAIKIGGEMRDLAMGWIGFALRWLGKKVAETGKNITRIFLRYLLDMFMGSLRYMISQALARIGT